MPTLYFAYPGDIDTPTGGYGYDRRIISGLRDLGWQVELVPLGDGFPFPSAVTLKDARERLAGLPEGALTVVDGLAYGVFAHAAAALAGRLSLIALVHHPLCRENGLSADEAAKLRDSEHKALAPVRHIIVTSPATAGQVSELFGVSPEKITVVVPGTDKPGLVTRAPSNPVRLLSVGTVVQRKGYDLLLQALSGLKGLEWMLDVVGGLDADPLCYHALLRQVDRYDLSERVTFHGAVPSVDLGGFYSNADIFVLASRYEGYGMAYTEALAHGLPVIGSGGGAVRETLPKDAAIYCGTEDAEALHDALEMLIRDPSARTDMAEAARNAAMDLPDWNDAARRFAKTLQEVCS
ncbi:glycosyltransferase family 4 protein [Roseibium sp.]|uniref:glycosyltransferase family 4 protein n=1 Tax=Roseibium sp. TaxID=1936156 RepID=UPI003D13FDA5